MNTITLHYDFLDPADRADYHYDKLEFGFDALKENGKLAVHQDSEYCFTLTLELDE